MDSRPLIASVQFLTVSRTPDGAIIRATGLASTQGQFNAQLVPIAREGSTMVFAFRAELPTTPQPQGSAASRQITVARILSNADLAGVQNIRVQAQENVRVSRR